MGANLYSFSEIFKSGKVTKIVIPIIQRDYAQGRKGAIVARVREKFLEALYDAVTVAPIKLDFVYGTIENGVFIPLDGQQRLTTLFLLHWYAAKKEEVEAARYEYLKNFGYKTRDSAQHFCSSLIGFNPKFNSDRKLSEEIIDAAWFPLDYLNDPTVSSMLVMLDAISEKFRAVDSLLEKLEGGAIKFYFRSIKDMGRADEIYIKMNSRGKPLTLFEHFKAELLRELKRVDEKIADRIAKEIDGEWTDLLWQYRKSDSQNHSSEVDDLFLRYFRFVCDIICYGNGNSADESRTAVGRDNDVFNLIKLYFSKHDFDDDSDENKKHNEEVKKNIEVLEKYFNIWCGFNKKEFFGKFISKVHEKDKIVYEDTLDLFGECIADERRLPLSKFARLFAFTVYLSEKDAISENDFCHRLRIIDNLIKNSGNEVIDSPNGKGGNRMPKILMLIRKIIEGTALTACDNGHTGFNATQFDEEIEKEEWVSNNSGRAEELFGLEDHPILKGQIGVVGLDKPERFSRFSSLFECDLDAINCALLAIGDFSQSYGGHVRLGGRSNTPWIALFHASKFSGFEKTQRVLRELLDKHLLFTNDVLRYEANNYIKKCDELKLFEWRYYFIKYDCFRPQQYRDYSGKDYGGYFSKGKYKWFDARYDVAVVKGDKLSTSSYKPFLVAIGNGETNAEDLYNIVFILDKYTITSDSSGYKIKASDGSLIENVVVPQHDGVDIVDRVQLVKDRIKNLRNSN